MRVNIAAHLGIVNRALYALRSADLRGAFNLARKPARTDQRAHAKAQEGPDGRWAPRSPLTLARAGAKARKRARRILGRLPNALALTTTRKSLKIASRVRWSLIHQEGGRAGHGSKIPARPFLWASDPLLERVAGLVSRALEQAWAKAVG